MRNGWWSRGSRFAQLHEMSLLAALHAAFLVTLAFLYLNDSFENRIFTRIAVHATAGAHTQRDTVLDLLHATSVLVTARSDFLAPLPGERPVLKEVFLESADAYLLGSNACGSYAIVLARLLQEIHRPVRVGQMRCDMRWGCHIFVEAQVNGTWAVLDPSYDLYFTTAGGRLASAEDLTRDWPAYAHQLPATYDARYKYDGVRYTNWNKIPVILPAVHRVLLALHVRGVEGFSARTKLLALYRGYARAALVPYCLVCLFTLRKLVRRRRRRARERAAGVSLPPGAGLAIGSSLEKPAALSGD